jgi:hypothetical protein
MSFYKDVLKHVPEKLLKNFRQTSNKFVQYFITNKLWLPEKFMMLGGITAGKVILGTSTLSDTLKYY